MKAKARGKTEQRGPSTRQLRVAEEVRHLLSACFSRGMLNDPHLVGVHVTVTEVRMTPDLRHATAFVSCLGRPDVDKLLPSLRHAAPFLRGELAKSLKLRGAPELHFQVDETLDEAMHISKLLNAPEVRRDLDAPKDQAKDS